MELQEYFTNDASPNNSNVENKDQSQVIKDKSKKPKEVPIKLP